MIMNELVDLSNISLLISSVIKCQMLVWLQMTSWKICGRKQSY